MLTFSKGEPFASLLLMLFKYSSQDISNKKEDDTVKQMRDHLKNLILSQLLLCNTPENAAIFLKYLVPDMDKISQICDVLFILSQYHCIIQKEQRTSIFEEFLYKYHGSKNHYGFATLLFLILHTAINEKMKIKEIQNNNIEIPAIIMKAKENEESKKFWSENMEDLIAYSLDILLSLNWEHANENIIGTMTVKFVFNPGVVPSRPQRKNCEEKLLELIRPGSTFNSTQEIILAYILQRQAFHPSKNSHYEKLYLGEKSYLTLLKHVFVKPLQINQVRVKIDWENIYLLSSSEFNIEYTEILYKKIIQNTSAFDYKIREQIFVDLLKLLNNSAVLNSVLKSEEIAIESMKYLNREKYTSNHILKNSIEQLILTSLLHNWQKKQYVCKIFEYFPKINQPIFISLLKDLILRLSVVALKSNEGIYNLQHLLYILEDFTVQNTLTAFTDIKFASFLCILLLILDNASLLYFWHPTFSHLAFHTAKPLDFDPKCTEREGGIVRIILRILFAFLIKAEKSIAVLLTQALDFYIFHDKFSKKRLVESLIELGELPKDYVIKDSEILANFITFNISNDKKMKEWMKFKIKSFDQNKSIAQQKLVWDLFDPTKDVYESSAFKLLLIFSYISQVVIYTTLDITNYREISFFNLESEIPDLVQSLPQKTQELLAIAGKLINRYANSTLISQELDKRLIRMGKISIKNCFSDIDMLPKGLFDPLHSEPLTPVVKDSKNNICVDYTFETTPPESNSTSNSIDFSNSSQFKDDLLKVFRNFSIEFGALIDKACSIETYILSVAQQIINTNYIKIVQSGLHEMITEDFKYIDKAIFLVSLKKQQNSFFEKSLERLKNIDEFLINCSNEAQTPTRSKSSVFPLMSSASFSSENRKQSASLLTAIEEYEKLRKTIFSDKPFRKSEPINKKVYKLVAAHYEKLLNRCPLHKVIAKKKCYNRPNTQFKTFMKLSFRRDNLDRSMRLKPMKNPLKSMSVLKGINYMRQFFLKRVMITQIMRQQDKISGYQLIWEKSFLIQNSTTAYTLYPLFSNVTAKLRLSIPKSQPIRHKSMKHLPAKTPSKLERQDSSKLQLPHISPDIVRSQGIIQREPRSSSIHSKRRFFDCEIIKLDTSYFGSVHINKQGISYNFLKKEFDKPEYRLGSSKEMSSDVQSKRTRQWKFSEMNGIIIRGYNLMRQAIEIYLANHKSVFIILFSEENLNLFIKILQKKINKHRPQLCLVDHQKQENMLLKAKEDWKHKKITNFEYLMTLNFCSDRSFSDLSQYPVFPWVLSNYDRSNIDFTPENYRDFRYPMAGINEYKRTQAMHKFENADEFTGGAFQYGAHYLPGRAVLGYLMRMQPFSQMLYKFDSGGDCPARHFHLLEKTWSSLLKVTDMNLELIPEFFYMPELFANINNLSFGNKQMDCNYNGLKNLIVKVDSVILPPWAKSNHHFVYINYMALEENHARENLHNWIDLIWGYKQQKGGDFFNLFKPLTSEVFLKIIYIIKRNMQNKEKWMKRQN